MTDEELDQLIRRLGQLRDRNQRLEEFDLISAQSKGYSGAGQTVAEIREELTTNEALIAKMATRLSAAEFD